MPDATELPNLDEIASALFDAAAAMNRAATAIRPPKRPPSRAGVPVGGSNAAGTVLPDLGGRQFHPAGDPWRQDVTGAPVHPRSADIINYAVSIAGGSVFGFNAGKGDGTGTPIGFPYNVVPENQPLVPVTYDPNYGMKGGPASAPIPDNPSIEGVAFGGPVPDHDDGGDHHMIVLVRDDTPTSPTFGGIKEVWELYSVWKDPKTGWNVRRCVVKYPGVAPFDQIPEGGPAVDAGGTELIAGLVTFAELQRAAASEGDLGHALRCDMHSLMGREVAPARSGGGQSDRWNNPLAMPDGTRMRLRAAFDVNSVNAANYPTNPRTGQPFSANALAQARAILRTVQRYGMIADDASGSGNFELQGTMDSAWDANYPEVGAILGKIEAAANLEVLNFDPGYKITIDPPQPVVGQTMTVTVSLAGPPTTTSEISLVPQWFGDPACSTPCPVNLANATNYHFVFQGTNPAPQSISYTPRSAGTVWMKLIQAEGARYEPEPLRIDVTEGGAA